MKYRFLISVLVSLGFVYSSIAQLSPEQKDSLYTNWIDSSVPDSIRYQSMYYLAQKGFLYEKPDSAYALGKIHFERAAMQTNKKEMGLALLTQGISQAIMGNSHKAKAHFEKSLALHEQIAFEKGAMRSSFNLANIYKSQGDTLKALDYYKRSEKSAHLYNDSIGIIKLLSVQADLLSASGQLDSAMVLLLKHQEISFKIGHTEEQGAGLNKMGSIYSKQGDYGTAVDLYSKALTLGRETNSDFLIANSLTKLSRLHYLVQEYEKALTLINESILIHREMKGGLNLFHALSGKKNILTELEDFPQLKELLIETRTLAEEVGYLTYQVSALLDLANFEIDQNNYRKALLYCDTVSSLYQSNPNSKTNYRLPAYEAVCYTALGEKEKSLTLAKQALHISSNSGTLSKIIYCHRVLAEAYVINKKYEDAYEHIELADELEQKLTDENDKAAILKSSFQLEYQKKLLQDSLEFSVENELLKAESTYQKEVNSVIVLALSILGLLSVVLFFLFRKNWQQRINLTKLLRHNQLLLKEKDTLLKEIHHRVKNNLQVVSSLLSWQSRETKDIKAKNALLEGQTRVQSMSLIHQNLYNKDNLTAVKMDEYLEKLVDNLRSSYHTDSDKIAIHLHVDHLELDVENVVPIGLIINELVTNSLKHAFPSAKKGNIFIGLKETSEGLLLRVSDDGIGIENTKDLRTSNSFGLGIVKAFAERLDSELHIECKGGTHTELLISDYKKLS